MDLPVVSLRAILPSLIVLGTAAVVLLLDLLPPRDRKGHLPVVALAGVVAALLSTTWLWGEEIRAFHGMVVLDGYALFLHLAICYAAGLVILLSMDYLAERGLESGEYYVLVLLSTVGMMLMTSAGDLIVVFLALELLSIPLYVLAGFARPRADSEESAMKYFLLGAFASGFFVYGVALTYGATQTTNLQGVVAAITSASAADPLLLAGAALILVGLSFKVAAVPFHMWTPDVYEGAPTVVTAFMSVGAKAGGFAALLRVFFTAFPALSADWVPVVAVVSALTMTLGNVVAIAQSSIKRMLAYSSIAHAGYILMAAVAGGQSRLSEFAASAALFYLMAYALMNLGAWAVVIAVEKREGEGNLIDDFAGLGATRPGLALAMAVFMLSLTGLPPTVGFIGKFYVFRAAIDAGYMWLALVGVVTSLISAFYYLRVVYVMYMQPLPEREPELQSSFTLVAAGALTALAVVVAGIYPTPILSAAQVAVLQLVR